MELDNLYLKEFKKLNIFDRKISIESDKTILYGVKNCGKTSFAINYLKEKKRESYIYIDFNDFRINKKKIELELPIFIKKNPISILVIDNFDFSINLPEVKETILITNRFKKISNFETLRIYPLDFEEYLSFDKRHHEIVSSFNHFLKDGTFPEIISTPTYKKFETLQKILLSFCKDEIEFKILKECINYSSFTVSNFQIYNNLKREIKISKDRLYKVIEKFHLEGLIHFIEKYNSPKANRKLYMIDFTLIGVINFNKNFKKEFENMVFLTILKRKKEAYYYDNINFYLPKLKMAIFPKPFVSKELIEKKILETKAEIDELNIEYIRVITLNFEIFYKFKNLTVEALPFYAWATQD